MKWQILTTWLIMEFAASGWFEPGSGEMCGPGSGAGVIWAAEPTLWELQPYGLHAILCADASPAWSAPKLSELARNIEQRCTVEYGRVWQMTVEVAGPEVRSAALAAADHGTPQDVEKFLARDGSLDKWMVVVLRASAGVPAVETWEYDVASRRWNCAPSRWMGAWSRLDSIVFESLGDACSPLAIVKSQTDQRVVLRLRGGLLPVRNPRRAAVQAGAIFQLVANNVASVTVGSPPAYVIVEKVDGHLLECRSPGPLPDLRTEDVVDGWVAVGVRPRHAATEFSLTMVEPTPGAPLAGCDIWLSDRFASQGTYLGRTDERGAIVVAAADGVRWLHVRWGAVLLEQFPVVPGWGEGQLLMTHVRPATLAIAAALAECHDDVAELTALRGVYLARVKARERAGKTAESQSLREECQTLLQQRVPELRNVIRERRHRAEQESAGPEGGVDTAWRVLEDALSQLLPAEAAKSP